MTLEEFLDEWQPIWIGGQGLKMRSDLHALIAAERQRIIDLIDRTDLLGADYDKYGPALAAYKRFLKNEIINHIDGSIAKRGP